MTRRRKITLYPFTTAKALASILRSQKLNASTRRTSPKDVRYGNGQYLTDIEPGTLPPARLTRALIGLPFDRGWFTHFLEIDVTGLELNPARKHVSVVPNTKALSLMGRIVRSGETGG
jgi:hypothetical protein